MKASVVAVLSLLLLPVLCTYRSYDGTGRAPQHLQLSRELKVYTHEACYRWWLTGITENMECVTGRDVRTGFCEGDSGGPVFAVRGGIPYIVGAVHKGGPETCGSARWFPELYTSTSGPDVLKFIVNTLPSFVASCGANGIAHCGAIPQPLPCN